MLKVIAGNLHPRAIWVYNSDCDVLWVPVFLMRRCQCVVGGADSESGGNPKLRKNTDSAISFAMAALGPYPVETPIQHVR